MTIQTKGRNFFYTGVGPMTASTQYTLTAAQEADLVNRGDAFYVNVTTPTTAMLAPNSLITLATFNGNTYAVTSGKANIAASDVPAAQAQGWVVSGGSTATIRQPVPNRIGMSLALNNLVSPPAQNATNYTWTAGNLFTWSAMFDVESEFEEVALVFANASTTNDLNIVSATVAVAATAADPILNSTFGQAMTNGSAPNLRRVTFGGNQYVKVPAATITGIGGTGYNLPSLVCSDFIKIPSVPRTDVVGARPLLFTRYEWAPQAGTDLVTTPQMIMGTAGRTRLSSWANGFGQQNGASVSLNTSGQGAAGAVIPMASTTGLIVGMIAVGTSIPGGAYIQSIINNTSVTLNVATSAALAANATITFKSGTSNNGTAWVGLGQAGAGGTLLLAGFLWKNRNGRIINTVSIGDSISAGAGATTTAPWNLSCAWNQNNLLAGNNSAPSPQPISPQHMGFTGATPAAYYNVYSWLRGYSWVPPLVWIYAAYSPNGFSSTDTSYGSVQPYLTNLLAAMDQSRVDFPIVWTGIPGSIVNTAPGDLLRQAYNTRLFNQDVLVVDIAPIMSTGTTAPLTIPAALTGDGTHPNNAGNDAMSVPMQQKLAALAVQYFGGIVS